MLTKNHAILAAEVKAHVDADAVIAGEYWTEDSTNIMGGRGCFIGCLSHGSDASVLEDRFGFPIVLTKICEDVFEGLSRSDGQKGVDFFAALPDAVGCDGKDLSLVHWKFLEMELRALPAMPSHIQDVIDPVIEGVTLLASGEVWSKDAARAAADAAADAAAAAADAAAAAADAARAVARAAAVAVADPAAHAVDAAVDAAADARIRQRDTLLKLIAEA